MRRAITFFSRSIAVLCSILFIVAVILVLLLLTAQYALLDARIYQPLMVEHRVYERLPALLAEQSTVLIGFLSDPCMDTLSCLDQYGDSEEPALELAAGAPEENPLVAGSSWLQACARQALGDEAYEAVYHHQRTPTLRETRRINACLRAERKNERASHPGLGSDLIPLLKDLSTEQWEHVIRLLLPAEDLRQMTETALAETSAYLKGESDTVSVPLLDMKQRLTGETGDELIRFILSARPPCTNEQQTQILAGHFENGGGTAIYCAAFGDTLKIMLPAMQKRLDKVASQIPDEVHMVGPSSMISIRTGSFGSQHQVAIRTIRDGMRFSPLVPISLLLLTTLFGVRSGKDWLRWWGIPLLVAGLITLAIGLSAQPLLDWAWVKYAVFGTPPFLSSRLGELAHELSRPLAAELRKWIVLEASVLIVLGLTALIHSRQMAPKLAQTKHAFTAPELAEAEEARQLAPPRRRDDTGYS